MRRKLDAIIVALFVLSLLLQLVLPLVMPQGGEVAAFFQGKAWDTFRKDFDTMFGFLGQIKVPGGMGALLLAVVGLFQVGVVAWFAVGLILMILAKRVWQPKAMEQRSVCFEVIVPKGAEADAGRMVAALRKIRSSLPIGGLKRGLHFALEMVYRAGEVRFQVWCPETHGGIFQKTLTGSFPRARVVKRDRLLEGLAALPGGTAVVWKELELMGPAPFPLRRGKDFASVDPLTGLIEAVAPDEEGVDVAAVSIVCRSAPGDWKRETAEVISGIKSAATTTDKQGNTRQRPLESWQREQVNALEDRRQSDGFDVVVRIIAAGRNRQGCGHTAVDISRAFAEYNSSDGGQLQGFTEMRSGMWDLGDENPLRGWAGAGQASGEAPNAAAETAEASGEAPGEAAGPAKASGEMTGESAGPAKASGKRPRRPSKEKRTDLTSVRRFAYRTMPPYFGRVLPFGIGRRKPSLVVTDELGWIWYPPGPKTESRLVNRAGATVLPAPQAAILRPGQMAIENGRVVEGATRLALGFDEDRQAWVGPVRLRDLCEHIYGVGGTGSGKTEEQKFLAQQWMLLGPAAGGPLPFAYIDAKGTGVADMLGIVPLARERDVVLYDPRRAWVVPYNPLDHRLVARIGAREAADGAMALVEKAIETKGGMSLQAVAMLEVIRMAIRLVACAEERPTLQKAYLAINDDKEGGNVYRERLLLVAQREDSDTWDYFSNDYTSQAVRQSAVAARRRFRMLLTSEAVRPLIAVEESLLDFEALVEDRRIFLARVGKDLKGDQSMVGSMIFAGFLGAGHARYARMEADPGLVDRLPILLYIIDEFGMFARMGDIDEMTSLMRGAKFAAGFWHQFLSQLSESDLKSLMGNVGFKIIFPLRDDQDATRIAKQSAGALTRDDIMGGLQYHPFVSSPGQGWYGMAARQPLPTPGIAEVERQEVSARAAGFEWPRGRARTEQDAEAERLLLLPWREAAAALVALDEKSYDAMLARIRERQQCWAHHIIDNPGCILDKRERITALSDAQYGVWKAAIHAALQRQRAEAAAEVVLSPDAGAALGAAGWWKG